MWTYNSELYHYGILGMKWGQHRAAKLTASIARNTAAGKSTTKIQKQQNKLNRIKRKEKNFKDASKVVSKMSGIEAIVHTMLLGSFGSLKYIQARANGRGSVQAVLSAIGNQVLDNATYGLYSFAKARKK